MLLDLPAPIAAYFAADKADGAMVARCFTENGVVRDEDRSHAGHAAITRWKDDATARYAYDSEPFAIEWVAKDRGLVLAHLSGDFPGSPVDLRYFFHLEGDAIVCLEIVP